MELAGEVGRELILRDAMAAMAADFDYVILDCPPSLGVLTLNALTAADEVFLPLQPHFLGAARIEQIIEDHWAGFQETEPGSSSLQRLVLLVRKRDSISRRSRQ